MSQKKSKSLKMVESRTPDQKKYEINFPTEKDPKTGREGVTVVVEAASYEEAQEIAREKLGL